MSTEHDDDAIDLDAICRSLSHPAVLPQLLDALNATPQRKMTPPPSHAHAHARVSRTPVRVRKNLGVGSIRRNDRRHDGALRRIVVAFDEDTFAEVRARAERQGTSFAEQVRTLVEWGLEAE